MSHHLCLSKNAYAFSQMCTNIHQCINPSHFITHHLHLFKNAYAFSQMCTNIHQCINPLSLYEPSFWASPPCHSEPAKNLMDAVKLLNYAPTFAPTQKCFGIFRKWDKSFSPTTLPFLLKPSCHYNRSFIHYHQGKKVASFIISCKNRLTCDAFCIKMDVLTERWLFTNE